VGQGTQYKRKIPDLRQGEVVVVLMHRHALSLLRRVAWPILLLVGWMASAAFVLPLLGGLDVDPLLAVNAPPRWVGPLLWALWLGVPVLAMGWVGYIVLDWREDWIALTTRRLIVMNKTLFLREVRRECPIGKVQNVIADFPGAVGMALDFGDLRVDTAGVGTLSFGDVPHPRMLREAIFKQQEITLSRQPPPEDLRKAAVRGIILGGNTDEGPVRSAQSKLTKVEGRSGRGAPGRNLRGRMFVSGYGVFNSLLPFEPQRDGESVTWHKHWSYLVRGLLGPVLIYTLAMGLWLGLLIFREAGTLEVETSLLGWLVVGLFPVCAGWGIWKWEDWRNDLYKLDHERVYHVESLPFGLREQSKETLINRISDVMYEVPGPLANLLNYGNVVIKTPGEATEFDFKGIPCPREVQQEIMERVDDYRRKGAAGADREIEAWIKAYHDVVRGA
jgi:hypothetical protein